MNNPATMQTRAENYLDERRRLGFGLRTPGYSIMSFARYFDGLGHQGPPTTEIMADWARRDKGHSDNPATWARRLKNLRSFTRYLQQFDPRTEVPDDSAFGPVGQRLAPHIYSEQEIVDLLAAAREIGPSLRGATCETLFGLIASAGLRISEAVHLLDADVDLKRGMLTIRQTKFAKSRQVPLHPSTGAAIDTASAAGKLVFGIFAALAEFERDLIVERTQAGLAAARARGRNGGRPYKMTPAKLRLAMAATGKPETKVGELCRELEITRQTLYRHVDPGGALRPDGEKLLGRKAAAKS
jgi:integrase